MLSSCRQSALPPSPAPQPKLVAPFTTVDPEGNTIDLSNYLGKDVIMLDFWATWCGPCVMAMPEMAALAEKYKDQGLVFYAVNQGEDPDTVKSFLAKSNLDLPVAMDFRGQIHRQFNAKGLPHTVIIGRDGSVRADHLGYRPGMALQMEAEVERLLNEKPPSEPTDQTGRPTL